MLGTKALLSGLSSQLPKALTTTQVLPIFNKISPFQATTASFNLKAVRQNTPSTYGYCIVAGKKKMGKSAVWRRRAQRRIKAAIGVTFPFYAPEGKRIFFLECTTTLVIGIDICIDMSFLLIYYLLFIIYHYCIHPLSLLSLLSCKKGYDYIFYVSPPSITEEWPVLVQQVIHALQKISYKIDNEYQSYKNMPGKEGKKW
ncbi:hypothetical protein BDF14DRAFT_1867460 [Spinellus fusiger]|nr:hypothetical protein BDF14DRAFT_1867460 [Spinellus fusiger]